MPDDSRCSCTAEARTDLESALSLLLESFELAQDCRQDTWQFAVELASLLAQGCTASRLRWLLAQGYAEQAVEMTRPRFHRRSFRPVPNLALSPRSCFVLTA